MVVVVALMFLFLFLFLLRGSSSSCNPQNTERGVLLNNNDVPRFESSSSGKSCFCGERNVTSQEHIKKK